MSIEASTQEILWIVVASILWMDPSKKLKQQLFQFLKICQDLYNTTLGSKHGQVYKKVLQCTKTILFWSNA